MASDLQQLRQVLREAVYASRMPARAMERALGIGNGNLSRLLDGQLDLRVRHLLALADLLGIPPADFLDVGCPDAQKRAKRRLGDWIGQPSQQRTEQNAAALSMDQLKELIRETFREELERRESQTPETTRRTRRGA